MTAVEVILALKLVHGLITIGNDDKYFQVRNELAIFIQPTL